MEKVIESNILIDKMLSTLGEHLVDKYIGLNYFFHVIPLLNLSVGPVVYMSIFKNSEEQNCTWNV
jgi:hypothetical protein